MMFAYFHSEGTAHSCGDIIIHVDVDASGRAYTNLLNSFHRILCGIQYSVNHLISFISHILLATNSGVTMNCPNFSV